MARPQPDDRASFSHFETLTTRWNDNDPYGHMNNAVHYQLFDTAVNQFLIRAGILDLKKSNNVFLVVSTACDYFGEMAFPDTVHAGLRISKLGSSSVVYEIGLFRNDDQTTTAQGRFVHVNVDRENRQPTPLSQSVRNALESLCK